MKAKKNFGFQWKMLSTYKILIRKLKVLLYHKSHDTYEERFLHSKEPSISSLSLFTTQFQGLDEVVIEKEMHKIAK